MKNKKNSIIQKKKINLKNINFKKNWKKLSYLGLAGFLALSSIGYGGWKFYEQESASAAGWRTFANLGGGGPTLSYTSNRFSPLTGGTIRACTTVRSEGSNTRRVFITLTGLTSGRRVQSNVVSVGSSNATICTPASNFQKEQLQLKVDQSEYNYYIMVGSTYGQMYYLNAY